MATYAFDVYPSNDPAGKISTSLSAARLVRLTVDGQLVSGWYKHVGHGLGEGQISIHTDHADATETNIHKRAYVMFVRTDTDPEQQIGGFFLEEGDFLALSRQERGGRVLTFGGPGSMFYLDRYVLGHSIYADGQDHRGDFDVPDQWTWSQEPYGAMLLRAINEGQDHPDAFFAAISTDFTRTRDSNANLWDELADYETPIGTSVLELYADFLRLGLIAQMDAGLGLSAYRDIDEFRTDRTSATFAANKARFEAGVNIVNEMPKRLAASQERSHVLIRDRTGDFQTVDEDLDGNPLGSEPYMTFLRSDTTADDTAIIKMGQLHLTRRQQYADQATVTHIIGSGTGQYAPGPAGDYWVLDLVTLHTGDAEHDFNEAPIEVASIRYFHDQAGNWFAETELGAQYIPPGRENFERQITSTIRLTKQLQLCQPTVVEEAAGISFIASHQVDSDTLNRNNTWDLLEGLGVVDGDLILVEAMRDGGSTIPTIPGGFNTIGSGGGDSGIAYRGGWRIFDGSEDSHEFTLADSIHIHVYRGVLASDPIGDIAGDDDNNNTMRFPALTLEVTDGTSWVVCFGHSINSTAVGGGSVTSLTSRESGRSGETGSWDTNTGVSSWTQKTLSIGSSFWQSHSYEIKAGSEDTTFVGDGHADLIGDSVKATRCDHAHHVFRDTAPTVNDDETDGYPTGTLWVRLDSLSVPTSITSTHLLIDNTDGAAQWETFGGGVDLSAIPFLVTTATGLLSAEVAVGATPGGELGGTWASPTVDATHGGGLGTASHLALGSTSSTAAAGDHTHGGSTSGHILITSEPAGSPLVFTDLTQNSEGTDLLYASEG